MQATDYVIVGLENRNIINEQKKQTYRINALGYLLDKQYMKTMNEKRMIK